MLEHITIPSSLPTKRAVIWLHGLGADGHDFSPVVPLLKVPDTRFIFPHAPVRPVTLNAGYHMRAWFDIHGIEKESPIDWVGLHASEAEVIALIEQEVASGIPYDQIYLAGFSQGGMVAVYTALRFAHTLAGVIGLSTLLPIDSPIEKQSANASTPFFIAHGVQDDIVPFLYGKHLAEWLQSKHYPVTWHEYKMRHEVCETEITDLATWLQ